MKRTFTIILLLASSGACMLSCAARESDDRTQYMVVADNNFGRKFPGDKWIVGIGESSRGPADAGVQARARISEQLESSIRTEFKSATRLDSKQSGDATPVSSERHSITSESIVRSTFEHAELIRVIDDMGTCSGGLCTAVAVLNRDQAAAVFHREYSQAVIEFQAAATQAQVLAGGGRVSDTERSTLVSSDAGTSVVRANDVGAFASAYNAAARAYKSIDTAAARAAAVGRPLKVAADIMAAWSGLRAARAMMAASVSPMVTVEPPEPGPGGEIVHTIIRALSDLGVTAEASSTCNGAVHLRPSSPIDCRRARMGWDCAATVRISASGCRPGSAAYEFVIDGERLSGTSPYDQDKARAAARLAVTPEAIMDGIRNGLKDFIPLD
ncbi:MAG TPA: hypothetical protein PLB35_09995 [Myxococcota bacterium]|nr:hypothetical protein [Myxococcota bacterium]